MKKIRTAFFTAVTSLLVSAPVLSHAQAPSNERPRLYGEIGYAALNLKATDGADTAKAAPSLVTGVLGYQFMPHLAVEGLVGFSAGKDGIKLNGVASGVDAKIGNTLGVFIKPSFALGDRVDLFARAGFVHSKLTLSGAGESASDSGQDVAYGIGANVNLSRTSYLQASWMNYYNKNDVKIDGFSIAYGLRF